MADRSTAAADPVGHVGHVILPVADVGAALDLFTAIGMTELFRDGDRYAALRSGSVTIALAARSEQPVAGKTALGLKVENLESAAARLIEAGAEPLDVIDRSEHERRQTFGDRDGNVIVAYEPRRPAK